MVAELDECVVACVCGSDGIAAFASSQFSAVVDVYAGEQETLGVRRRLKEMYSVKGSQGVMDNKVGRESLLELVKSRVRARHDGVS